MPASELAPALLVAMPQLRDSNFRGAVVLLVHHDDDGTFGLVVNRDTDLPVSALCDSLDIDWNGGSAAPVSWGGPVQPDHGWVLLGEQSGVDDPEVRPVAEGIRFSSSPDVLRAVAAAPPPRLRVFLGYAGWGPGQLAAELAQGAWIVAPVTAGFVFESPLDQVWDHVLGSLGINPATLVPTQGVN